MFNLQSILPSFFKLLSMLALTLIATNTLAQSLDNKTNPWPEIRKQRLNQLLPNALKAAEVDAWLIVCRENNNDPLADHIGCENAGAPAAYLFYQNDKGFHLNYVVDSIFL